MFDPPNTLFSACSFLGFIMSITPLYWHWEAENAGACLYMFWCSIANLNQFINSVVWNKSAINYAPVWCDISMRLLIAGNVSLICASLCMTRRLYSLASYAKYNKRRELTIDLSIGLGIPVLAMILTYIVQGHRFDILEEIGCYFSIVNRPPTYPLFYAWPIVLGLVSGGFGVATIYRVLLRHHGLRGVANYDDNFSRHIRVMILSCTDVLCTVPLSVYFMYLDLQGVTPWVSWSDVHADFSAVWEIPSVLWKAWPHSSATQLSRWSNFFCALLFFAIFGTGEEAFRHYRAFFRAVGTRLG
ncbi:STE3-like pheromone receptor, partial [Auriscalpium vulgare]